VPFDNIITADEISQEKIRLARKQPSQYCSKCVKVAIVLNEIDKEEKEEVEEDEKEEEKKREAALLYIDLSI
jgi:CO dehydrogenase nickel-insertion accessory protein CooC1